MNNVIPMHKAMKELFHMPHHSLNSVDNEIRIDIVGKNV